MHSASVEIKRYKTFTDDLPPHVLDFIKSMTGGAEYGTLLYDMFGGDVIQVTKLPDGPYDLFETVQGFTYAAVVTNNAGGDLFFIAANATTAPSGDT